MKKALKNFYKVFFHILNYVKINKILIKDKVDLSMYRKKIKMVSRICFGIYIIILLYLLLLSDDFSRIEGYSIYRYNVKPFQEILRFLNGRDNLRLSSIIINLLGNVVAFIPFGALIRWVINRKVYWFQVVLYTFLFSLFVEFLQLILKVGVFDVDDLLLNTLGGLFGFWIYYILRLINKRSERK